MDFSILSAEEKPKTLYHYTSLEALVAIVNSKRVRASNIRFLNDESESLWLKQHVVSLLKEKSAFKPSMNYLTQIIADIESRPLQALFVASFTEKADDLSQWRAYCPLGLGVSIGFSTKCLSEQWIANPKDGEPFFLGTFLKKVRYYSPTHKTELEAAVDSLLGRQPEAIEHTLQSVLDVPPDLRMIPAWLEVVSPFFKHDAFAGEAEWRKVVSKDYRLMPGQQFRQGKSTLIPFIEIMLDVRTAGVERVPQQTYFIDEVMIGPTPNPELTLEAVLALLATAGHSEVLVRNSHIPFKSW